MAKVSRMRSNFSARKDRQAMEYFERFRCACQLIYFVPEVGGCPSGLKDLL